MKNYVMLVDMDKCNQCYACALACKDEHFGNDFLPVTLGIQELGEDWVRMHIEERGNGSKLRVDCWPEFCRHCAEPECAKANDAVYKREDGIVIIDPEKAKGGKKLTEACPFGAIAWNEEKGLPQKCTLCAHLLDAGESAPRCVEACPNGSLKFGDLSDQESAVAKLLSDNPELKEQSGAVRYYNRPGRFIAGSVYLDEAQAAIGAQVCLSENGSEIARTVTNGFGDFVFNNLPEDKAFKVEIALDGYAPLSLPADTSEDVCFEELTLNR